MELDHFQLELSETLESYSARGDSPYLAVTVLALLWEEDDMGVIEEVVKLLKMFETLFHFDVRQFVIPTERSQASSARAISDFVYDYGAKDSLIIIYYGGHGDPDQDGQRESIWAAKTLGGPTLRWHQIQPILEGADADVALFLDCCYAGTAARARSDHRVELLAAASMNLMTPGVRNIGAKSFTMALVAEMTRFLNEQPSFSITSLHRRLLERRVGLVQQPLWVALFENSQGSIVIKPLMNAHKHDVEDTRTKGSTNLVLQLSMFEKPNSLHKDQVLKWLTTARPSNISAITVESVFSRAEASKALGERLVQEPMSVALSDDWLNELPVKCNERIKRHLEELKSAISPSDTGSFGDIAQALDAVQAKSDAFNAAVSDCIPEWDTKTLHILSEDSEAKGTGLSNLIEMRLILLEDTPVRDGAVPVKIKFDSPPTKGQRFRSGNLNGDAVLVEYWYYNAENEGGNRMPSTLLLQVKRIAALLARLKSPAFRTFLGKGFVHELLPQPRFGMAYQVSTARSSQHRMLMSDLLKSVRYVPLESRLALARATSNALLHFHKIGWLHKGIKSENILLFASEQIDSKKTRTSTIDFLNPYIFGFDYSRQDDAESYLPTDFSLDRNLYRHPERWGLPVRFQRKHDIFALGVLLLELGIWKRVASLDPDKKEFRSNASPKAIKETLIRWSSDCLAHYTGEAYASATRFCLSCDLESIVDGKNQDFQITNLFRKNVVDILESALKGSE